MTQARAFSAVQRLKTKEWRPLLDDFRTLPLEGVLAILDRTAPDASDFNPRMTRD
jgi:hypothetical protein